MWSPWNIHPSIHLSIQDKYIWKPNTSFNFSVINTIASPTFVYRFIFDLYYACIRYILFNRIIVIINLESLIPQVDDTLLATSMMLSFFRDCSILKLSRLISSSIIGNYIGEYVVHITLLQLRCLNLFVPPLGVIGAKHNNSLLLPIYHFLLPSDNDEVEFLLYFFHIGNNWFDYLGRM